MSEKYPWDLVLEEQLPPRPPHGGLPPHFLMAEGQKMIWQKLLEIEQRLKALARD